MSKEEDVRKASNQFYNALTDMGNGIAGKMEGLWSHDESVTAMHPIGGRISDGLPLRIHLIKLPE